jgi:hypothetical protein
MGAKKTLLSREYLEAGGFALLFILASIRSIQLSGLYFMVMEHRMWFEIQYDLGFDLTWIIALLCGACVTILLARRRLISLLPLLGLLLTPLVGFDYALAAASLLASLTGVYDLKIVRSFLSWLMVILGTACLTSLIYWMLLLPMGYDFYPMVIVYLEQFIYYMMMPSSFLFIAAFILGSINAPVRLFIGKKPMWVDEIKSRVTSNRVWIILGLILLLNVYSVFYLTLPTINAGFLDVGTDVADYVVELVKVDANLSYSFKTMEGTRPVIFFFLRGFQAVFALDAQSAVTYSPIIISALLVLSVFLLTREMLSDETYALWASFFTVTGFHFVVGMYSFFITNMLALAITYTMLALTFRALKTRRYSPLAIVAELGVVLLFTHPWTLAQYMAPFGLLVLLIALRGPYEIKGLSRILLAASTASMGLAELLKTRLLGGYGVIDAVLNLRRSIVLPEEAVSSILNSFFAFSGLLANPLLLGLAAVGLTSNKLKETPRAYLSLFLFTSTTLFLIMSDGIKQRLIYNIPWGILAALGILRIMETKNETLRRVIPPFIAVCLLVYEFRSLANLF